MIEFWFMYLTPLILGAVSGWYLRGLSDHEAVEDA